MTLREVGLPPVGFMVTVAMVTKEQKQQRLLQVAVLGEQCQRPLVSSVGVA